MTKSNKISKEELDEIRNHKTAAREYTNGEVTVFWKRDLCIHSANCLLGLPHVFNMGKRPWINMQGGSTEDIIRVVNTCPTHALTWLMNNEEAAPEQEEHPEPGEVRIQVLKNGPLIVKGLFGIEDSKKEKIPFKGDTVALCRCGGSHKKPFCDGTHKKIDFQDL